jgi:glutathione S-transferase
VERSSAGGVAVTLELIELYASPWSERLRWVLDAKGLPYARRTYQPLADEEDLRRTTGSATVPVLLSDGEAVGDSDAAVDWLEARHPEPALVPADSALRAQVRAFEVAATEALAPFARLAWIGRVKAMDLQPLADHFAAKYGWSPDAEARGGRVLRSLLLDLARMVSTRRHLVGDGLTRADITVAAMLAAPLGHPPEELFALEEGFRSMFGLPVGDEPAIAPLRAWRDETYRRHRGRRVTPPV